ncbi:hypothetical protein OOZ63_10095 [Paucibacter sp. PLA-PC-4]|uniref:hypothetical protein n=1 Tax=Paucibacter sp. PLA-PC-4 TaxID=2993655 RepID=UPI0022497CAE|nr:hypothetical protein [Paucibacter sp. PLA-PC-4]MCX2862192.1 hypothetical protein [Paucibacter sp. PLA-PC-4]
MKLFLRCSLYLLSVLSLTALLAVALALQTAPAVPQPPAISAADVAKARSFLRRNDPRLGPAGELRSVQVSEAELALLLNYLSSRHPQLAARLSLQDGHALARASLALGGPFWLNASARLVQNGGLPRIEDLRLGRLPLPDWLTALLRERTLTRVAAFEEARLLRQMIKHVALEHGRVQLAYEWHADSYRRMLDSLLPAADQARLRAYSDRLVQLASKQPSPVSVVELLTPLFQLAVERTAAGQDAAAENRAVLLSLAAYASGQGLGRLVPAARGWPQPRPLEVQLYGRPDFPLHLLISAVLAAEGGGPLADAVGIYKEQADVRSGSGFSFNDIAADRAGSRLGLLAVQRPQALQRRLAAGLSEAELLPDVSDLPEYLSAAEFRQQYGGPEAPAYRAMMARIEALLDDKPLLP